MSRRCEPRVIYATRFAERRRRCRRRGRGVVGRSLDPATPLQAPAAASAPPAPAAPRARSLRDADRDRSRSARGHRRPADSERCARAGREGSARGALHRSCARRRAGASRAAYAPGSRRSTATARIVARQAVPRAVADRSGLGADRRRGGFGHRTGRRFRRQLGAVLRDGAELTRGRACSAIPYYGGNANFVGWDLISYPGVRTMVTAADQQALETGQLKPNHKSAYDFESFNKATAQQPIRTRRATHGD